MSGIRRLLSGNEALALGAYHAGVKVATAYPGTPSTEILEAIARFDDVYAEWSTNEKVAMEVALGASYTGVRAMASMKQVGLNVASDPFMAASTTGVDGGLVVICADDPGAHSSQGEQDNRHYARLAKVPMLEPSDSQEAYDFMAQAFDLSEQFDTPVMVRTTTRISHSKTVVEVRRSRGQIRHAAGSRPYPAPAYGRAPRQACGIRRDLSTQPGHQGRARTRGGDERGCLSVCPGGLFQSIIPSFLKLGMTYPLPRNLLHNFATQVKRLIVIEELDPFLQENIQAMGIEVTGKEFIPRVGELNPDIIYEAGQKMGLPRFTAPRNRDLCGIARATSPPLPRMSAHRHFLRAEQPRPARQTGQSKG